MNLGRSPRLLICNAGLCRGREPEYATYARSCRVTIAAYSVPGKENERRYQGLSVVYPHIRATYGIDPIFLLRRRYSVASFAEYSDLEEIVKDADIVITQDPNFFTYSATVTAKRLGKRTVMMNFENVTKRSVFLSRALPYRKRIEYVIKNTDDFVPQTEKAREFLLRLGVPQEKAKVIYPGVDLRIFRPDTGEDKQRSGVRILLVGTLTKSKGVLDVLRAFRSVARKRPAVTLTVVGDGPLSNAVDSARRRCRIDRYPRVGITEMARLYRSSDVFVLAPKPRHLLWYVVGEEQLGYALLEAMASALPVVISRTGSLPEIPHLSSPSVDPGDVQGLAKALLEFIDDEDLRLAAGRQNRERTRQMFDLEKQSAEFIAHITSAS